MSRSPYHPRAFFRHVPPDLVHRFADQSRLALAVAWTDLPADHVGSMYDAWMALRPVDRTPAEGVFRQVHDLATAAGVQALVAEGLAHGVDLADELEPVDGFHAKALTAFLRWPQVFRTAWQVHHADALPGRYWRRRTGLDHVP